MAATPAVYASITSLGITREKKNRTCTRFSITAFIHLSLIPHTVLLKKRSQFEGELIWWHSDSPITENVWCPFPAVEMKRRRSSVASDGDGSRMTSAVSAIERRLTFAWTTCMTEDKTETGAKKAKRYLVNFHILILSLNSKCYRISPDTHPARGCRCTGHEFNQLSHRCMGVRPEKRVGIFFSSRCGFVLPGLQL